jgi:hypothetical protein
MSTPQKSSLLKGALATTATTDPAPVTIPFQYNPETLVRSLTPRMSVPEQGGVRLESVRFRAAPEETIQVEIQLDSVDASGVADATAPGVGIYPQLCALELLVYPTTGQVQQFDRQVKNGQINIAFPAAPLTLFIWGKQRVVPVLLRGYSITEQAFDASLNPVRAKVELTLYVLSYFDLAVGAPGYAQFLVYQQNKEALASQARVANAAGITGVTVS